MPTSRQLYAGLPKEPRISAIVELWKGGIKPFALLGIAATALAGFFHYVSHGPNEVEDKDEESAAPLTKGGEV